MDNITEIKPSPENIEIPENWKFPERNTPYEVIGIDANIRYLAVKGIEMGTERPFQSEYIFDRNGNMVQIKNSTIAQNVDYSTISLARRELDLEYFFINSRIRLIRFGAETFGDPLKYLVDYGYMGTFAYDSTSEINELKYMVLGSFDDSTSEKDHDNKVRIAKPYKPYKPYEPCLVRSSHKGGLKTEDWRVEAGTVHGTIEDPRFTMSYQVEDNFLVVSQTRVEDKMVKVFRAPLRLDQKKIADVAFAKLPYERDSRGNLNIPWLNISSAVDENQHRILDASISYSYPPPPPKNKSI